MKKGFTLAELLIVCFIIGIMIALIIPASIKKNNKFEFKNSDNINCICPQCIK